MSFGRETRKKGLIIHYTNCLDNILSLLTRCPSPGRGMLLIPERGFIRVIISEIYGRPSLKDSSTVGANVGFISFSLMRSVNKSSKR